MGRQDRRFALAGLCLIAALAMGGPCLAQADLISRDTFSGLVDARLVAAGSETSFVDGGFGKSRFGKDRDGLRLAEIALVWNPRLNESFSAVVSGEHQDGQERWADVGEAYLRYHSSPQAPISVSARAGLFWPDISLEHDGLDWTTTDTLTPSAINSWVGEELKVEGAEATVRGAAFGQDLALTAAAIWGDDTSGTLLSTRGWSMSDLKETANGVFTLPPLSPYLAARQRPETTSILEIDNRAGYYAALTWRPADGAVAHVLTYDNMGDRTSVTPLVEWAWATRFTEAGASFKLDQKTRLKAQAMRGETLMGYPGPEGIWVDVLFSSAYVSVTRDLGGSTITGRLDGFGTTDRTTRTLDNNDEHGWSATAAWGRDLPMNARLIIEGLYIDSVRPSRPTPHEQQAVFQTAVRWRF